jgi:hypothetical protein
LQLIGFISNELNALLPAHYVARAGERLYVLRTPRNIFPDVVVKKRREGKRGKWRDAQTAVAVAGDPSWTLTLNDDPIREGFIEIRAVDHPKRVVANLEVLSHTNKMTGSTGRKKYLAKQREVLASPAHLVEIDLLRRGRHTVVAPLDKLLQQGIWDYLVCLSRGDDRDRCEVWGFTVRQKLPRIRVPLAGDDPDIVLDLQKILDQVYDAGKFERDVDYRRPPAVPLSRADAKWARSLLREKGLRR